MVSADEVFGLTVHFVGDDGGADTAVILQGSWSRRTRTTDAGGDRSVSTLTGVGSTEAHAGQSLPMSSSEQHPTSRVKQFRALAEASARGVLVVLPRRLSGDDRRLHVRQTLREDRDQRIAGLNEDAEQKFDKLAASLFSFFRGTALVFYREMAGEDSSMPTVLTLGDVHPENFGVMPTRTTCRSSRSTTSTRPTTRRSPGTSIVAPSGS